MDFDYEAAWLEVAKPAYEALPEKIKLLFETTSIEMADKHQNKSLGLDWNEDGSLKKLFEGFDSITLSQASRAIYFCGHWGSSVQGRAIGWPEKAQSWKFALLADQILSERCGLIRGDHPRGISFAIHEGILRVCVSTKDCWMWEEIGPGTVDNLTKAKDIMLLDKSNFDTVIDRYEANAPKAKAELWSDADPFKDIVERYSRTRYTINAKKANELTVEQREALKTKMRDELDQELNDKVKKAWEEMEVKCWLIDHGIPLDNFIWYDHNKTANFGWRERLSEEDKSDIIARLEGAPFAFMFDARSN